MNIMLKCGNLVRNVLFLILIWMSYCFMAVFLHMIVSRCCGLLMCFPNYTLFSAGFYAVCIKVVCRFVPEQTVSFRKLISCVGSYHGVID